MSKVYAWWTALPVDKSSDQPKTGWVHENGPPWRVITFDSPRGAAEKWLHASFEIREYDGDEATIPWQEAWPHLV